MEDITFKTLTLSQDKKACYIDNKEVILTPTEYTLFLFLLTNREKVFSRRELIELSGLKNMADRSIDTNITRLRRKLGEYGNNILTRRGFGYGFREEI